MIRGSIVGLLSVIVPLPLAHADSNSSAEEESKAVPTADSEPDSTLFDFAACPADGVQLVGETRHLLLPESDAKCQWTFKDGVLTASPSWDSVVTPESYRDFRMHVEFNVNDAGGDNPEANGNSGLYIQQRYELQILNSHGVAAEDYKDSYCGSLYRLKKPDVLVSKPAGEWQSYDLIFRAARFDDEGKVENARIIAYQNGHLIHDDVSIARKTGAGKPEGREDRPIKLQGHHNKVRFRNVWIQRLSLEKMPDSHRGEAASSGEKPARKDG